MEITQGDIVLCAFYFSDLKSSKNRPVLVLKDNLPFDDFIAVPISSKIEKMYDDEAMLNNIDFENGGIPRKSKLMLRKTFVVSKSAIVKKYGKLKNKSFQKYHHSFCDYFQCKNH
jgi:mRNA interferase MazF